MNLLRGTLDTIEPTDRSRHFGISVVDQDPSLDEQFKHGAVIKIEFSTTSITGTMLNSDSPPTTIDNDTYEKYTRYILYIVLQGKGYSDTKCLTSDGFADAEQAATSIRNDIITMDRKKNLNLFALGSNPRIPMRFIRTFDMLYLQQTAYHIRRCLQAMHVIPADISVVDPTLPTGCYQHSYK